MLTFETVLALLVAATLLSVIARRIGIPYPTLLALGGVAIALVPGTPRLDLPPELILTLFVAPVLLDAAYDASLRDLRDNWRPVFSLVLVAVGLTTLATAIVARLFLPDLPWAAAIALGALLAPPDAVAALAVLAQVSPPHRIRKTLEGESLLNDASALLIYRLAVTTVSTGGFSFGTAIPTFAVVLVGSLAFGWFMARPTQALVRRITDAPTSVIAQFALTFLVWLAAEKMGLSGVITMVVFGLTMAHSAVTLPAYLRIPSFAIWESITVVLNVLAFTLIGLQIRPILESLNGPALLQYGMGALAILATVILVRLVWVLGYNALRHGSGRREEAAARTDPSSLRGGLVIGWAGMRGIVTLAAAMALPADFPHRDFMQLTAFVVVLGTLTIQGLTLRPLLLLLRLPKDGTIEDEVRRAREAALEAALTTLAGEVTPAALRLREEFAEALALARRGDDPRDRSDNALRRRLVTVARQAITQLRSHGTIGDDAFQKVEEELDWLEISAQPRLAAPPDHATSPAALPPTGGTA